MVGKICIVTGANAGIGLATALGLSKMGATIVMVCRNRERGQSALTAIKKESGTDSVHLIVADLSSGASIRQAATDFSNRFEALDVLINNAAVIPPKRLVTVDGLETQFAVNYLAGFHLTSLLLDTLKKSDSGRIINVSSNAHQSATIDFDDLQSEHSYNAQQVYQQTKLANVLFTYEIARRLLAKGIYSITANCLHPGVIATQLLSDYSGVVRVLGPFKNILFGNAERGAETSLYLAASAEVEGISGKYYDDQMAVKSSVASYDSGTAQNLWRTSQDLIT